MAESKKIVFLYKNSSSIPDQIIESAQKKTPPGFELCICDINTPNAVRREHISSSHYIIAYSVKFDDFDIVDSVNLFQLLSAGFDLLNLNKFEKLNIPVANNGSVNSSTVAEHSVLLILSLLKRLPIHHNSMLKGTWLGHSQALQLRDLRSKRVGLIGFGHIGREVAQALSGFRAKVSYFDPVRAPIEIEIDLNVQRLELEELLRTSDIISIHMPLNKNTRGLIGKNELSMMKKSALLINTARGPIIDEEALIEALDNEQISGAGLDVFHSEPLSGPNPLVGRDNVIHTPHIAGTSVDNWERRIDFCFDNILRVSQGKQALAVVSS